MKEAKKVTIYSQDTRGLLSVRQTWDVLAVTESGAKGKEYALGKRGIIHRVCGAAPFGVGSALTSGQRIVYHY
jgi:hypothetical protein